MTAKDRLIANVVRYWGSQEPMRLFPPNIQPLDGMGKSAWQFLDKIARETSKEQGVDLIVKECEKQGRIEYDRKVENGTLRPGERPKVERISHRFLGTVANKLSTGEIVGDKKSAQLKKVSVRARKKAKQESSDEEVSTDEEFLVKAASKSKSIAGKSSKVRAGGVKKVTKQASKVVVSSSFHTFEQAPYIDMS